MPAAAAARYGAHAAGRLYPLRQWDREECVGPDELNGRTADGELSLCFDTIGSIARRSRDSSLVTLLDGREIVLSDTPDVGHGNRGIYVDDRRYGRVLISWDAFERVDLGEGNAGMLIFVDGRQRPEYVPWTDVEQVVFDRPPATYPPLGGR